MLNSLIGYRYEKGNSLGVYPRLGVEEWGKGAYGSRLLKVTLKKIEYMKGLEMTLYCIVKL